MVAANAKGAAGDVDWSTPFAWAKSAGQGTETIYSFPSSGEAQWNKTIDDCRNMPPDKISAALAEASDEDRMGILGHLIIQYKKKSYKDEVPPEQSEQERRLIMEASGVTLQAMEKALKAGPEFERMIEEDAEECKKLKAEGKIQEAELLERENRQKYHKKRKEFYSSLTLEDLPPELREDTVAAQNRGSALVAQNKDKFQSQSQAWQSACTEDDTKKAREDTAGLLSEAYGGVGAEIVFSKEGEYGPVAYVDTDGSNKIYINTESPQFKDKTPKGFASLASSIAHEQNHLAQAKRVRAEQRPRPEDPEKDEFFSHNPTPLVRSGMARINSRYVDYSVLPHEAQS